MSKVDEEVKAMECVEYVRSFCGKTKCENCPFFVESEYVNRCSLNTLPYMVELEWDSK